MPVVAREALVVGSRVSYEDMANPRREGRIVEVVQQGGTTPSGFALPTGTEYRVRWDDPDEPCRCAYPDKCFCKGEETTSDLRQHGWYQLADYGEGHPFDGAEIIAAYTREQALADGELVALDHIAQEAGFKVPVAVTRSLWNLVEPTDAEKEVGQSTDGRLWDVLSMARLYGSHAGNTDRHDFPTIFYRAGRGRPGGRKTYRLRLVIGPGDAGEPVITIGFPQDF